MSAIRQPGFIRFVLFVCLFFGMTFSPVQAQYVQKVIVKSGDPAPGTMGAIFNLSDFNPPTAVGISTAADVLFRGALEIGIGDATLENAGGLWAYDHRLDELRLVFRPGIQVSGLTGATFVEYNEQHTSIDLTGQIGVYASYSLGGVEESAFFMEARGTSGEGTLLRKVYKGMELLPSMPGATISGFTPIAFNNGRLLFSARIEGSGITLNEDDLVLCMYESVGITVIVRKYDPMPTVGNEYILTRVTSNMQYAPLDALGNALVLVVGGSPLELPQIHAAYYWKSDHSLDPFALSHLDTLRIIIGDSRFNSTGGITRRGYPFHLALNIMITSGPIAAGDLDTIATGGKPAHGAGGATFGLFREFVLFDDNQVAVHSILSDGKSGIWIGDKTGLKKVALVGDQAPGLDSSFLFTRVNGMMANRVGQIAFSDLADDGVSGVSGIWLGNTDGLIPISLTGHEIDLDDSTVGTIESHFAGHLYWTRTGADGYSALLNDSGKIAYGVSFQAGGNALLLGSPGGLIVNSNADLPDIDLDDGRCYTGRLLPDGRPECTLRAAIAEANKQSGPNLITFDIDGDATIIPETNLPTIQDSVSIDATTQTGFNKIILAGVGANVFNGLDINGQDITINGLVIKGFPGSGISIVNGGYNRIYGCTIGSNLFENDRDGIYVSNSSFNMIGGTEPKQANKISNNKLCGIVLDNGSNENRIINNEIGVIRGQSSIGNEGRGILIQKGSNFNVIGGDPSTWNTITGNGGTGITISESDGNRIDGNVITGNLNGISIVGQSTLTGVYLNFIGIDIGGLADGNEGYGVIIAEGSADNEIGSKTDGGNTISDNDSGGVHIISSDGNSISNNFIGTSENGLQAMGNRGHGVRVTECLNTVIGQGTFLGQVVGHGNLISGNDSAGVAVDGGSVNTVIASNLIGVGADTITAIGNYWGITSFLSPYTIIGTGRSVIAGMGNIIANNTSVGIKLVSDSCYVVSNLIVENGTIGTLIRGDGIYVDGSDNIIGLPMLENNIFGNDGAGVFVDFGLFFNEFNRIQYNSFSRNYRGGIELAPEGVNLSDSLDLDFGPNQSQNAPLLESATLLIGDVLSIKGSLHSAPNQAYHVIVYSDDDCASLNEKVPRGGYQVILEDTVFTDAGGDALIDISEGPWHPPFPEAVTMIVTDTLGNTSEFSNCLFVTNQSDGVDLVVTKTDHADSVAVGDTLRYEITVTNLGTVAATNVRLVDTLSALTGYLADSTTQGSCLYANSVLNCNLGAIPALGTATVTMTATPNQLGLIENIVLVSSDQLDVDLSSNVAVDTTISSDIGTGIAGSGEDATLPNTFTLSQNYPNPFNPATTFEYSLPEPARVSLTIFNILGQEIRSLVRTEQQAGYHSILWDGLDSYGSRVSSGVYLYRLVAGDYSQTRKMVLLK